MRRPTTTYLTGALAAFVLLDLAVTFWQNYRLPLDGDLVAIVLPAPWYEQVLRDPFGWQALTQHAVYGGAGRFFVHAEMGLYWKLLPRLLRHVVDPISSLYLTGGLFATATQALLLLLLAAYVRAALPAGVRRPGMGWLLAALLAPFFQTAGGFYEQMGITDRAVTYTFFYGFALVLLLALLWPFYQALARQQPLRLPWPRALALLALMPVVALGSPIGGATFFVLLLGAGAHWAWGRARRWQQHRRGPLLDEGWLSWQAVLLLGALTLLCLYDLYLGRHNVENTHDHTLRQLYALLPVGLGRYLGYQLGLPLLLGLVALQVGLVWGAVPASPARQRVLRAVGWVALLVAVYVLLLPLGGYRTYRPNLLRNDTALPLILGLLFAYALLAYFLLSQLRGRWRGIYAAALCLVGARYLYADNRPDPRLLTSDCERWSLDQLARAPQPVVELTSYCNVLTWAPLSRPEESEYQGQLLYYWGVTPAKKLYFQK